MNESLARALIAEWNVLVMLALSNDLMSSDRLAVYGDAFGSVANLNVVAVIADPDLFARIEPWHRITAAAPRDICVPRHFALLVIHIRVGRPSVENRLHGKLILIPTEQHPLMRRAVNSLIGHLRYPAAEFGVEIREVCRLTTLQSAQEVSPHILHSRFHFAFGLRPVWTAQPRRETPVAREVEKDSVPDDLATFIGAGPDGPHPVVKNLLRNSAPFVERCFVHPQQRSQLLIGRGFGHHPAAVAQGDREAPHLLHFTVFGDRSKMPPVHLSLVAWRRFKSAHCHRQPFFPWRPQPLSQNRISAAIVTFPKSAQEPRRVPPPRLQPFLQIRLEWFQFAHCRGSRSVDRPARR